MEQHYIQAPHVELEVTSKRYGTFTIHAPRFYVSNRTLENPAATATIRFMDTYAKEGHISNPSLVGKRYRDLLQSNDAVKTTLLGGDKRRHADVTGLVKSVMPVEMEQQSGEPEHSVEVRVEGVGGELANYQIFWHPHIAGRNNLGGTGFLARSKGKIPRGKPHEVLQALFDTFMNDDYVFRVGGKTLREVLDFIPTEETGDLSLGNTALSALGNVGALWPLLKRYSDAPWNELFVDIQHERSEVRGDLNSGFKIGYSGKEALYFRPTPFGFDRWNTLASTRGWGFTVDDEERVDDGFQLHRDQSRIYNFFFAPCKGIYSAFDQLSILFNQSNGILPLYDGDSIRKHGYRNLTQETEYVQYITKQDELVGPTDPSQRVTGLGKERLWKLLALRTLQLYQWYGYDNFWDGTFTVRGRIGPHSQHGIRVGSVITRNADGWQYYVTGVRQICPYPGVHTTQITVERGRDPQVYLKWWMGRMKQTYTDQVSTYLPPSLLSEFGLLPETFRGFPDVTLGGVL